MGPGTAIFLLLNPWVLESRGRHGTQEGLSRAKVDKLLGRLRIHLGSR